MSRNRSSSDRTRSSSDRTRSSSGRTRSSSDRTSTSSDTTSTTPVIPPRIPFYASERDQESPIGWLSVDDDTLTVEFEGDQPPVRILRAEARKIAAFDDDCSFRLDLPEKKISIHLRSDGNGRFLTYGIRAWARFDKIEPRAVRKQEYLDQFESNTVQLVVLWQLILPCVLFGIAFVLAQSPGLNAAPEEVRCMIGGWQGLAIAPVVAVHFAILLTPALAIFVYKRISGLRNMFLASLLLVMLVTAYGFFPDEWHFLSAAETSGSLMVPGYWLIFAPYMILLFVPALHYVVVEPQVQG